ncbi:MAG: hypothetical protein RDU13_00040 [Elusimicrobiales bacterium]|nr:hypothetical protein [Elusimicrobiales bacterium]
MGKDKRRLGPRLRRGAVLLQTLVISVVISMIAVMVMKWVLARYSIATRVQRAAVAEGRADGCIADRASRWTFANSAAASGGCDSGVGNSVSGPAGNQTITITVTE